jgi:hypothetical protein
VSLTQCSHGHHRRDNKHGEQAHLKYSTRSRVEMLLPGYGAVWHPGHRPTLSPSCESGPALVQPNLAQLDWALENPYHSYRVA